MLYLYIVHLDTLDTTVLRSVHHRTMEISVLRYVNMTVKNVIIEMVALQETKPWVY